MLEQPALAGGGATPFDFATEPLVVVNGAGQQVKRDLVDCAPGVLGQPGKFRYEFGRNLQVHEASVGGTEGSVN